MTHTRLVAWLRILLPLVALGFLATLFLWQDPEPESTLPYAEIDADRLAGEAGLNRPEFATIASNGAAITLDAAHIGPATGVDGAGQGTGLSGSNASGTELRLTWRTPDNLAADLTAPRGDIAGQEITLSGGVRLTTSDGWTLSAPTFKTDTGAGRITSADGDLHVFAPLGQIKAGAMALERRDNGDSLLDLSGGVRLLYQP